MLDLCAWPEHYERDQLDRDGIKEGSVSAPSATPAMTRFLRVPEVAAITRYSPRTVRRKCATGEIQARRWGNGSWRIPAAQFETAGDPS